MLLANQKPTKFFLLDSGIFDKTSLPKKATIKKGWVSRKEKARVHLHTTTFYYSYVSLFSFCVVVTNFIVLLKKSSVYLHLHLHNTREIGSRVASYSFLSKDTFTEHKTL